LSPQTAAALASLGVKQVLIPGGPQSVSSAVEAGVKALGIATLRFAGADRFDTAAQIAAYAVGHLGFSFGTTVLADGLTFADALAAGPFAGRTMSPVLLTGALPAATESALAANAGTITGLIGFGRAASTVPAAALAAGATLTINGTLTAQGTALCGFPSSFTFTGQIGSAAAGAAGHLTASLTTSGATGPVDIDLTAGGTPVTMSYTSAGALFTATGAAVAAAGTPVIGTGSVTLGTCTANYAFRASVT